MQPNSRMTPQDRSGWTFSRVTALRSIYAKIRTAARSAGVLKCFSAPVRSPIATLHWIRCLCGNTLAKRLFHRKRDFLLKPLWEYLNRQYRFADRVRTLVSHYEFVVRQFTDAQIDAMYFGSGLVLAEFSGRSGGRYRVSLATYSVWHDEGEMLLRIETADGEVICFAHLQYWLLYGRKIADRTGMHSGGAERFRPKHYKACDNGFLQHAPKVYANGYSFINLLIPSRFIRSFA
jgi:hypothetical protein